MDELRGSKEFIELVEGIMNLKIKTIKESLIKTINSVKTKEWKNVSSIELSDFINFFIELIYRDIIKVKRQKAVIKSLNAFFDKVMIDKNGKAVTNKTLEEIEKETIQLRDLLMGEFKEEGGKDFMVKKMESNLEEKHITRSSLFRALERELLSFDTRISMTLDSLEQPPAEEKKKGTFYNFT
jgi:hypothetical protein